MFVIQLRVCPATYQNIAKMVLGRPTGHNCFFQHTRVARRAKKVSFFAGSELGWIQLA